MLRLIADGIFGTTIATWAVLAGWFFWRYLRPGRGQRRKPQQLILSAASLGWVAFTALSHGWMPHSDHVLALVEAVGITAGGLAALGVYLYEVEGGIRRQ